MARVVSEYMAKKALLADAQDLRRWRQQGLPFIKEGRQYYYDLDLVHRWFCGEEFPRGRRVQPRQGLIPESWRV